MYHTQTSLFYHISYAFFVYLLLKRRNIGNYYGIISVTDDVTGIQYYLIII
jgi:hypothetical protein